MADKDKERDQEEQQGVVISDKRHSRNEDEVAAAPEDEKARAEPELEVVEPDAETQSGEAPAEEQPEVPAPPEQPQPDPAAEAPAEGMPQSAEMDQLKLIFDAGISSYLAGQISMFINFALIYLGRAPNPASGLVATDIKKAKMAIDTLEFVSNQINEELPEAEQQQLAGIVADLKYTFMQAASGGPAPTPPAGNGN